MKPIVVIGSGHAGLTLTRELRMINKEIPIILVTQDDGCAYYKPNLSKAIALGKSANDLMMKSSKHIEKEQDIIIKTETKVLSINVKERFITVDAGNGTERIAYQSLVLGTGAAPIKLPIKGNAKDDVISVNTLDEYREFRDIIENKERILVIGAGFVGIEFASDIGYLGHNIDVVDMEAWPLRRALPEELGKAIVDSFPKDKVNFHFGKSVVAVDSKGQGYEVTFASGEKLMTDVVLSAVGIRLNIDLAKDADIETNRGIIVDNCARTSAKHIYAIGDCAEICGQTLPFIVPATAAAKALAKTLLTSVVTELRVPHLAVAVKIPTCSTIVCPSLSREGEWKVEGEAPDFIARFTNAEGEVTGFALTGKATTQKGFLLKECVAPKFG